MIVQIIETDNEYDTFTWLIDADETTPTILALTKNEMNGDTLVVDEPYGDIGYDTWAHIMEEVESKPRLSLPQKVEFSINFQTV